MIRARFFRHTLSMWRLEVRQSLPNSSTNWRRIFCLQCWNCVGALTVHRRCGANGMRHLFADRLSLAQLRDRAQASSLHVLVLARPAREIWRGAVSAALPLWDPRRTGIARIEYCIPGEGYAAV